MGIGFALAIVLLGIVWLLIRYCRCPCGRKVPLKITTPNLPADETHSESDEDGESRLANFLKGQQQAHETTSDVSQSDVWSFSMKSVTERAVQVMEDDSQSEPEDDLTFDASLYTTNEEMLHATEEDEADSQSEPEDDSTFDATLYTTPDPPPRTRRFRSLVEI